MRTYMYFVERLPRVPSTITKKKKKKKKKKKMFDHFCSNEKKKGKRKVQGVPQSQTAALPRHQEEEGTDKTKHAQIEKTYAKH